MIIARRKYRVHEKEKRLKLLIGYIRQKTRNGDYYYHGRATTLIRQFFFCRSIHRWKLIEASPSLIFSTEFNISVGDGVVIAAATWQHADFSKSIQSDRAQRRADLCRGRFNEGAP